MFYLAILWSGIGMTIGCLACIAQLKIAKEQRMGWLYTIGLAMLLALSGGLIGTWLLGRYFSSGCALWVSTGGLLCLPIWRSQSQRLFSLWRFCYNGKKDQTK